MVCVRALAGLNTDETEKTFYPVWTGFSRARELFGGWIASVNCSIRSHAVGSDSVYPVEDCIKNRGYVDFLHAGKIVGTLSLTMQGTGGTGQVHGDNRVPGS